MSLDKVPNQQKEKSRVISIDLPANNTAVENAVDNELDKGWHISTSIYDSTREKLRIIFTKPKRNG